MRLDLVQIEIHQRQAARPGYQFLAEVGVRRTRLASVAVKCAPGLVLEPFVGGNQESAGSAGRIADREFLVGPRIGLHATDDRSGSGCAA